LEPALSVNRELANSFLVASSPIICFSSPIVFLNQLSCVSRYTLPSYRDT
jgi:hypothetical protein